jgi:hypothetical protein
MTSFYYPQQQMECCPCPPAFGRVAAQGSQYNRLNARGIAVDERSAQGLEYNRLGAQSFGFNGSRPPHFAAPYYDRGTVQQTLQLQKLNYNRVVGDGFEYNDLEIQRLALRRMLQNGIAINKLDYERLRYRQLTLTPPNEGWTE